MRKDLLKCALYSAIFVAGLSLTSCGEKKTEVEKTETTEIEVSPTTNDTIAIETDTVTKTTETPAH
jgi:hypothetical protein